MTEDEGRLYALKRQLKLIDKPLKPVRIDPSRVYQDVPELTNTMWSYQFMDLTNAQRIEPNRLSIRDTEVLSQSFQMRLHRTKYRITEDSVHHLLPFLFDDLEWIRGIRMIERIVIGVADAVLKAEEKFDQAFGGVYPTASQFGIRRIVPRDVLCHRDTPNEANETLLLVYGFFDPDASEIQITAGSYALPIVPAPPVLFPEPIIIEPRASFNIHVRTTGGWEQARFDKTETTHLLGYNFSPLSYLITRR